MMDIDVGALKSLVREKNLSLDVVVASIEEALLVAYRHSPGASQRARVEVDRRTGHVIVWAVETDDEGNAVGEYDDTPADFGRVAATTAGQVLRQRLLRSPTTPPSMSSPAGWGPVGNHSAGRDPSKIFVDLGGGVEVIPPAEQVPADDYRTVAASRLSSPRCGAGRAVR